MDNLLQRQANNYVIIDRITINKKNHPKKFELLDNIFKNPNDYLNEELENEVIIGRKTRKEPKNNYQFRNFNILNKPNDSRKFQSSKSKISVTNNETKNKKDGPIISNNQVTNESFLQTNDTSRNNMKTTTRTGYGPFRLNSSLTLLKDKEFIDNNGILEKCKKIEKRKDNIFTLKNIFNNLTNELSSAANSSALNKNELMKIYNRQEETLDNIVKLEEERNSISKRLSMKSKKKEENLLFSQSQKYRQIFELKSKLENKNNHKYGNSTLDWQSMLRDSKNIIIPIGNNISSLYSTTSKFQKEPEIIRKPKISLNLITDDNFYTMNNPVKDLKFNFNLSSKSLNKTEKEVMMGSQVLLNTFNSLNQYESLNSPIQIIQSTTERNSSVSIKLKSTFTQIKNNSNCNNLFLQGQSLILIERDNALSLKGKKVIFSNYDKDRKQEEVFACQYNDIIKN